MEKELLFIDMDGVLANYELAIRSGFKANDIGFYKNLHLIEGAKSAMRRLREKYDVYVLSTPAWSKIHSWNEKREWMEIHFPELKKRLILSHNKSLFTGRALIDDNPQWNGAHNFNGEIIHFRSEKFPDWNTVTNYLLNDG